MKTIGIIGGLSWQSTSKYYNIINKIVNKKLGNNKSAKILLYSFNFSNIVELQKKEKWDRIAFKINKKIKVIENEVDFIIVASNTIHKVYNRLKTKAIPIIHILKPLEKKFDENNIKKIAFLGTKYTLQSKFIDKYFNDYNFSIVFPGEKDINILNNIIFNELTEGKIIQKSKKKLYHIIKKFREQNIKDIVLGCTELSMIIDINDFKIRFYDTLKMHAEYAAYLSLK